MGDLSSCGERLRRLKVADACAQSCGLRHGPHFLGRLSGFDKGKTLSEAPCFEFCCIVKFLNPSDNDRNTIFRGREIGNRW